MTYFPRFFQTIAGVLVVLKSLFLAFRRDFTSYCVLNVKGWVTDSGRSPQKVSLLFPDENIFWAVYALIVFAMLQNK